jgi:hypothetical protein
MQGLDAKLRGHISLHNTPLFFNKECVTCGFNVRVAQPQPVDSGAEATLVDKEKLAATDKSEAKEPDVVKDPGEFTSWRALKFTAQGEGDEFTLSSTF